MNTSSKKWLQLVVLLCIATALIYWQYQQLSPEQWTEIKNSLSQTRWSYLFVALLVGFLSHLFRALRWRLLLQTAGYSLRIATTTSAVLLAYLSNTLIPRLGEVVRCTSLTKTEKVPFEKSLGTVISERVFDVLSLLVLFLLVFGMEYQRLAAYGQTLITSFFYDENGDFKTMKLLLLLLLILCGVVLFWWLIKKSKFQKLQQLFQNLLEGLKSIFKLKKKFLFLFYSVCMWFLYVAMVYIALKAVPDTAHLSWTVAMAITAFGSIAIMLTPGGIGAYPPIAAAILFLFDIGTTAGLALGWVSWTMQTVVVLILGIFALLYLSFVNSTQKQ